MTAKHTPGPWTIAPGVEGRVYLINSGKGNAIGEVVYSDARNPADARLIAAAPDLLAALQTILNISLMDKSHWAKTIEQEASAAIARATGEQA